MEEQKMRKPKKLRYKTVGISFKAYDLVQLLSRRLGISKARIISDLIENISEDYITDYMKTKLRKKIRKSKQELTKVRSIYHTFRRRQKGKKSKLKDKKQEGRK